MRKSEVLNSMKHSTRIEAKTKWREVHSIQKKIQKHTALTWKNKHTKWWKKLGEMDDEASTGEFWQLAAQLKPKSNNHFPTIMEDENGGSYRTTPSIMNHVQGYYTDISNNDDEQAHEFCRSQNINDLEISMIETKAKQMSRSALNNNERIEDEEGPCNNNFTWEELCT